MRTIYKIKQKTTDYQEIDLPTNSKILCVQNQFEVPCLWVMLNTRNEKSEIRRIRIIGTGNPILKEEKLTYIGTYQLDGGIFVFHVFEQVD